MQTIQPDALVGTTDWTPVNAATVLAAASDTTLFTFADSVLTSNSDMEFTFSDPALPPNAGTCSLKYSYRKNSAGGNARGLTVTLFESGTQIQQWIHTGFETTWAEVTQTISGTVTNWSNVTVRFSSTGTTSGGPSGRRSVYMGGTSIELPDGSAAVALIPKVWTGSLWKTAVPKVWTGSIWKTAVAKSRTATNWK